MVLFNGEEMPLNCYATDKVIFHPKIVQSFMVHCSHEMNPVFIHLMPQNFCNQNCSFCSYRMEEWKNSKDFDKKSHIPIERLIQLVRELDDIGVKAIEITGGGEPLAHPQITVLLQELATVPIETALVTNGTLLKEVTVDFLYNTHLQWARVSIDAGNKDMYCKVRRCPDTHWVMAWQGVKRLVDRRDDQLIGIGYVITDQNYNGVYEACSRARDYGVDNVRVSMAFTSKGADLLNQEQKLEARKQLELCEKLNNRTFTVIDLFNERLTNMLKQSTQNYDYCGIKDLLCVIEGACNVYTCCTLTGTKDGYIGNISEQTLAELWKTKVTFREKFDPRKMCKCACLYEKRNRVILGLRNPPEHINFI